MSIFDFFTGRGRKTVSKRDNVQRSNVNKYYKGYDNYFYDLENGKTDAMGVKDVSDTISLSIRDQIQGYPDLYECTVRYGHTGKPVLTDIYANEDLYGFEQVIIGLDKDEMEREPNYTRFVFTKLLERNRIKHLHDIEFDLISGEKNGNYVGSILEQNGNLFIHMNSEIGSMVENLPSTQNIKREYEKYLRKKEEARKKSDQRADDSRRQRIQELEAELSGLKGIEQATQTAERPKRKI